MRLIDADALLEDMRKHSESYWKICENTVNHTLQMILLNTG